MKFNKIVCADRTGLQDWAIERLNDYCEKLVIYDDYPHDDNVIAERIADADCVLVSFNTQIRAKPIRTAKNLKYIGMCCSLYDESSANVDIKTAKENGIKVLGVRDYGDEGVVEFIIAQLIFLYKGLSDENNIEQTELNSRTLGIIGMGTLGKMLAEMANAFGMKVIYYSRTRRPEIENENIVYMDFEEVLKNSDVISTHLPKNTILFDEKAFNLFGNNKVFINTSLSNTFEYDAFEKWISDKSNKAVFDKIGIGSRPELAEKYKNIVYTTKISGLTKEARKRLSQKVLLNIEKVLSE